MKQAILTVTIADDGNQKYLFIHSAGEDGEESYTMAQEIQKLVTEALHAAPVVGKEPVSLKPMEG